MKNTRKAAAVWLAMSLAISTAFGNTAWGEIHSDAGNNRCVHVHTAECYKDADKTATPSQIGKEPTECTHICSIENGCIRDTEKENNGNADENKNLNDVPAQNGAAPSASTPSNAEDTTATGGTVTQVPQTKILSWSWFDPDENLLDGRLELTGITEEAQPSFTDITEYLPTAIIARVEEGKDGENVEDGEEKNLSITNWSCPEYVQDEEGRWPLEGTYEFKAELPEGYELAEGVDALVVEVVKSGPACHTGAESCFFNEVYVSPELKQFSWQGLYELIKGRKDSPKEGSYTTYLFEKGKEKILKKVGEECTEVIIAGEKEDKEETVYEISDLAYHVLVLMVSAGITVEDVTRELEKRHVIDHKVKQERMQ